MVTLEGELQSLYVDVFRPHVNVDVCDALLAYEFLLVARQLVAPRLAHPVGALLLGVTDHLEKLVISHEHDPQEFLHDLDLCWSHDVFARFDLVLLDGALLDHGMLVEEVQAVLVLALAGLVESDDLAKREPAAVECFELVKDLSDVPLGLNALGDKCEDRLEPPGLVFLGMTATLEDDVERHADDDQVEKHPQFFVVKC